MGISQPRLIYPTPTSLPRNRKSNRVTLPPPVGGWNTRDDPVRMAPTDATHLVNFYPEINEVAVRRGFAQHATVPANTGIQTDSTNYLDAGDIDTIDALSSFTVEFWTRHPGGVQAAKRLINNRDLGDKGWNVDVREDNETIYFELDDGTTTFTASHSLPDDDTWYHFAWTINTLATFEEITPYRNGVVGTPTNISTIVADPDSGTSTFRVFANEAGTEHLDNGYIDDIRVWDHVRTATEILDNYLTENPVGTGLIAHWTMNGDGAVTTVADQTGYGNTMTDTGAGASTYVQSATVSDVAINIDTVVEFFNGTTRKLLAATPYGIYDATSSPATLIAGSFTSGQWQTAMMNGVMGLVNGADAPQDYDGTTLGAMTVSGTTAAELIGIHVFKSRSYFWKADSPSFWYSAVNALGGALTEFALGEIASEGGYLLAMTSWTVDGGSGPDDFAVFIMSSGEVLVYQGFDPGTSDDWGLVGSYKIPTPLGRRAITKVGGEILVMTDTDMTFLPSAFAQPAPPASKLKGAMETSGKAYRTSFGWQSTYYSNRNMLVMNIPISATQFEQYVVNMETGAPARFTGMNGRAWCVYNDELYFGTADGRVMIADSGSNDDGDNINADARQAWIDFGTATDKKVETYRMVFAGTTALNIGSAIAYDFVDETVSRGVTTGGVGTAWGSAWGTAWSTTLGIRDDWEMSDGYGQVLSPQVSIGVEGERPKWYRTDLMMGEAPNI